MLRFHSNSATLDNGVGLSPSTASAAQAAPARPITTWSLRLAIVALAAIVVLFTPLFLHLPLEFDVIQYDLCARNLLTGGVHYRDIFENNFPGIVWLHALVRSALGWSSVTLRAVDLAIVAAVIALLARWDRTSNSTPAARVALAALLLAFYCSTSEWCHCQRDTWQLLPAMLALYLRRRQIERACGDSTPIDALRTATLEGQLWGLAVWIKPHVIVPAASLYLMSIVLMWSRSSRSRARLLADAAGLLAGGLSVGVAGVVWLIVSGAWPDFYDIMAHWNPSYLEFSRSQGWSAWRIRELVTRFMPWLLAHLVALPAAIVAAANLVSKSRDETNHPAPAPTDRALLAALYFGWLLQSVWLQNLLDYVHVPAVLLAIALTAPLALHHERRVAIRLAAAAFLLVAAIAHPLLRPERLRHWRECFTTDSRPERWNQLAVTRRADWVALDDVSNFLRDQGVGDGEVTCFHATTVSIYLELGLRPSTRYVYANNILEAFPSRRELVRAALESSRQRFVVTHLSVAGLTLAQATESPLDRLPLAFPKQLLDEFPWSEPVVFRAGPYAVHRVTRPGAIVAD